MSKQELTPEQELDQLADKIASRLSKVQHVSETQATGYTSSASNDKPETHAIYDFMANCPNCGQHNPNYRQPTHRCKNCKVPVNPEASKCWNCAGDEAEKIE